MVALALCSLLLLLLVLLQVLIPVVLLAPRPLTLDHGIGRRIRHTQQRAQSRPGRGGAGDEGRPGDHQAVRGAVGDHGAAAVAAVVPGLADGGRGFRDLRGVRALLRRRGRALAARQAGRAGQNHCVGHADHAIARKRAPVAPASPLPR